MTITLRITSQAAILTVGGHLLLSTQGELAKQVITAAKEAIHTGIESYGKQVWTVFCDGDPAHVLRAYSPDRDLYGWADLRNPEEQHLFSFLEGQGFWVGVVIAGGVGSNNELILCAIIAALPSQPGIGDNPVLDESLTLPKLAHACA